MRSYYAHLSALTKPQATLVQPRPIFRSSAIFPVFNLPPIRSRILFMGYWILKRHIKEIAAVVTLRQTDGTMIYRNNFSITDAKAYNIELTDRLSEAGLDPDAPFTGSMEIEFFSTCNLVFPYPAVVINYYGPSFSTVVHTAQRVYNDFEDMQRNSQTAVPESGFNIYADGRTEPFIALINGAAETQNCSVRLQFFNSELECVDKSLELGTLRPYQTTIIYPAKLFDLEGFLKGKVGAGKANFSVNWIFPRLVVGNLNHSLPAMSITHTYYDCTKAASDSDYWRPLEPGWYPAALMIPAPLAGSHFTNIYFYPIYSPSCFSIDLEFYAPDGTLLLEKKNALEITSPENGFNKLSLAKIFREAGLKPCGDIGARVLARTKGDSRLPARVKLGLDIGQDEKKMPSNICTNLQPFNPPLETKPSSFHWGPILCDQPGSSVWIMSSSPAIHYEKICHADLHFYREKDGQSLFRLYLLPPHGFAVIRPDNDPELAEFFEGKPGWYTAVMSNPYSTTYYLSENNSGVVGGDHGF